MTDESLPRQDLLLKCLNMTTAENDGQALVAIRKANAILAAGGWSWEKLLLGKITIVEDPFKSAGGASPFDSMLKKAKEYTPPPPPPAYEPPPQPKAARPIPTQYDVSARNQSSPTPASMGLKEISNKGNNYANSCYCCGDHVDVQAGFIFRPSDFNGSAPNKWEVVCAPCNKKVNDPISRTKAMKTGRVANAPKSVNLNQL